VGRCFGNGADHFHAEQFHTQQNCPKRDQAAFATPGWSGGLRHSGNLLLERQTVVGSVRAAPAGWKGKFWGKRILDPEVPLCCPSRVAIGALHDGGVAASAHQSARAILKFSLKKKEEPHRPGAAGMVRVGAATL
jgi:hypothetical protein